jgi:Cu/Ag efflux protein CusF
MNLYRSLRSLVVVFVVALSASLAHADDAYTFKVKGVIRGMPGKGLAKNEILVKHQDIPEYRDESGKVVGMMAMTMPFYLSPELSLDGFALGDSVELEVEQHLEPEFSEKVVAIKKVG